MIVQEEIALPEKRHRYDLTKRDETNNTEEAAGVLLDLISPYYKSFPTPGGTPTFRKTLTSEEVQNILLGVHNIVSELLFNKEE